MARFVMANRRSGKYTDGDKQRSRQALDDALNSSFITGTEVVGKNNPVRDTARQVVFLEADGSEIKEKIGNLHEDVIVEPEIFHFDDTYYRPTEIVSFDRESLVGDITLGLRERELTSLSLTIQGGGKRLYGARVTLNLRLDTKVRSKTEITTRYGRVKFRFSDQFSVSSVVVEPAGDFWPMIVRRPRDGSTIECPALPPARGYRGWWHNEVGIRRFTEARGQGIRVGVIDTGVGPHHALSHVVDIGTFHAGRYSPEGRDVGSHGTHVCGIIGARSMSRDHFAGIAPGVSLFSVCVFPPQGGADQGVIAEGIDALSREHQVDLINLSLSSPQKSEIIHDAVIDAEERGTLCICAAANSNGPVEFPAALDETIAISAIGIEGWGPEGSLASFQLPAEPKRYGLRNLYHANFSCYGREINGAAPGVDIISSVPERFGLKSPYASMRGTSMATPAACAALAAVLSKSKNYKAMPREEMRTVRARGLFRQSCRDAGLEQKYQGWGIPCVDL